MSDAAPFDIFHPGATRLPGPWTRIEPITRASDFRMGLQAGIADPLWLLGRQDQVGELSGEDAATPVRVRGSVTLAQVTRLFPGEEGAAIAVKEEGAPPEVLLEREDPLEGPGKVRAAADAGLLLMRLLSEQGLEAVWLRLREIPELRLTVTDDAPADIRLLARRSIDGYAARRLELAGLRPVSADLVGHPDPGALDAVQTAWRALVDAQWTTPRKRQGSWVDESQDYAFHLGGDRAGGGPARLLRADDHPGGRLDWYSVDATGAVPGEVSSTFFDRVPLPIRFRGAPASRWWEFEDAQVNWAGIDGGVEDPARLMVAEFMTVYGDDWFVIPLRLARGQMARMDSLTVADTFTWRPAGGARSDNLSALAVIDGSKRTFRLFELRGDTGPDAATPAERRPPWLYLPASLGDLQEGDPIEEVRFIRDEAANLGWAIEKTVEGLDGGPSQRAAPPPGPDPGRTDGLWIHRIQTEVPHGWLPLLPVKIRDSVQIRLRRGRMPDWEENDGPKGRIVGTPRFYLREAELPPGGIVVHRSWQRTRSADGRVWLWIGREKRPGAAEPGPGLVFDSLST